MGTVRVCALCTVSLVSQIVHPFPLWPLNFRLRSTSMPARTFAECTAFGHPNGASRQSRQTTIQHSAGAQSTLYGTSTPRDVRANDQRQHVRTLSHRFKCPHPLPHASDVTKRHQRRDALDERPLWSTLSRLWATQVLVLVLVPGHYATGTAPLAPAPSSCT